MSGSAPDNAFSLSSSGYTDGLGRRLLDIDHETGDMLERLVLRPELSVFELVLRERVARAAKMQDERFARPRRVMRDEERRLTVVSEYVAGRRLSDAIDTAAAAGVVAGLDAGLGLLLELLPALGFMHGVAGFAHGSLAPGRLVTTPAGQLIVLDWIYGSAVERLQFTRQRLWTEFQLAPPPTAGPARLDISSDLTQAAMIAAALTISRPLGDRDFPGGIPALRAEILEVAQIRGTKAFAAGVEQFFDRLLPTATRRSFPSADEAVLELRQLVRREIGIDACRTAWIEFLRQTDVAEAERGPEAPRAPVVDAARAEAERRAREEADRAARERAERERAERDRLERERAGREREERERRERERQEQERLEAERLEQQRLALERREQERLEALRKEQERIDALRKEQERLEAERKERERLKAERRAREEAERLEHERLERERIEAERKERERLEAELRAREEAERLERERRERERIEAERRERERLEAERRAKEEAERLERERLEKERIERERQERERIEAERREKERIEAERRERERLEAERRAREEQERLARERAERERLEKERAERERIEAERRERERIEAERRERERLEAARREEEARRTREEEERHDRERLERDRAIRELAAREHQERERAETARRADEETQQPAEDVEPEAEPAGAHAQGGGSSRRKKREKSARARKDKLRSVVPPAPAPPPPAAAIAAQPAAKSWLVPPERAAAFEPPVPAPPPPAPVPPPAPPPIAVAAPRSYPVYVPPADSGWAQPPAPIAPHAAAPGILTPASAPIRLKSDRVPFREAAFKPVEPAPASPPIALKNRASIQPQAPPPPADDPDIWTAGLNEPEPRRIPWKLVAAAVAVLVMGGAAYEFWGGGTGTAGTKAAAPGAAAKAPAQPAPAAVPTTGELTVTTQPPGAKVLVDGKAAGTSPVTLKDLAPGRHTITLMADAGAVRRTVRVEAGGTATLDVPIFSGFVEISAPIVLQVSEGGRSLGTSENQIMLAPGHHELRLANADLNYVVTKAVEVEPGEGARLQIDAKGVANINAQPWAEVWIDGAKAGETPLANLPITLGVREIVFRNPQFAERKVVVTVVSGTAATVTVDFTKQ